MARLRPALALAAVLGATSAQAADMLVGRASRDALQDRVLQLVNEARVRGQRCGDAEGSKRGHVYWVQSFATPLPAPR